METEDEQVEKLKAWLKENGMSIVFGIVLGVGGIAGYNYWTHMQETTAEQASDHYRQMIAALESGNGDNVQQQADILIADYAATEYAQLAQLALARHYVDSSRFEDAASALQSVVGSAAQDPLAYVARTRLAAVQIELQRYDDAMATLSADFPEEFAAMVDELRGDALASQGRTDEAVAAYRKAQQASPANPEFLRQKLNDLGSSG